MTEQQAANAMPYSIPTADPNIHRPMPVIMSAPVADSARLSQPHQRIIVMNTSQNQDHYLKDRYLAHILVRPGQRVEIDMVVSEIATLHNLARTDRGHFLSGPKAGQPFPPHPIRICDIAPMQSRPSSIAEQEAELAMRSAALAAREQEMVEKELRLNAAGAK